jgi:Fur family transcriptional regulator, peroxide stress response regulator
VRIILEKPIGKGRGARQRHGVAAEAALRDQGFRLTGPRRAVLEVVWSTESHPTAERVHRLVRRRLPRVSLGTIYRNLRLLVEARLVKELPGPYARFDANTREHHHFTCASCGRIIDVDAPLVEPHSRALSARVAARTGLSITHHRIEFFGRCPECQQSSAARTNRRKGGYRDGRDAP